MIASSFRSIAAASLVASVLATPIAAQARSTTGSGPTYGVMGNIALPFSDLGNVSSLALGGGGLVEGRPAGFPVGLRGDASYNRFIGKDGFDGFNMLQFTGNAVFTFPRAGGTPSPVYAIGGLGFYRFSGNGSSSTEVGFNLGGGYNLKAATRRSFLEARLHFVDESEWISFAYGVRF